MTTLRETPVVARAGVKARAITERVMQMTVMSLVLARVRPCLHLPSQHLSHRDVVIDILNQQVKSQTTASKRGAYDIIILNMQSQLPT